MGTLFEIDKLGYQIKEIPIIFKDRQKGISKIPNIGIGLAINDRLKKASNK